MLRTIHLHGSLAEKFGDTFRLDVVSPAEAVRALCVQLPSFEHDVREGEWTCVRGDLTTGIACGEELIQLHFGSVTDFHIMPAALGRKRGLGKTILGIFLIATAFFVATIGFLTGNPFLEYAALAILNVGISMTIGGIAMMLSPTPKMAQDVDKKEGYLFNGASNTSSQGGAVPLTFGRIRAGSVVVSAGISSDAMEHSGDYQQTPTKWQSGGFIGLVATAVSMKLNKDYY